MKTNQLRVKVPALGMALAALGLLITGASSANATTIDFGSYASGTPLTSLDGITFSLMGGPDSDGPPLIGFADAPPMGLSNSTNPDYPTAEILNFAFSSPVSDVSFYFNDYGSNGSGSTYEAFGASDNLLETGTLTGQAGTVDNILTASGITDIQFSNNTGGDSNWYFAVTSLTIGSVPEPATWALVLAGFFGLGAALRRHGVPDSVKA
ncbi:MAG: PEPxxWA-CTERM sorting domain-containing protein [Caulobacteraceae bacterium]